MLRFITLLALLSIGVGVYAQPSFPLLTGRVVDNADLLSANARMQISQLLAQHEQQTSNQVVVVTLPNLDGYDIADYGYQLGRDWQLGQAGKDNGVLLIVAQQERKIRIEVGYGLEGALTDALSSQIIRREITPRFKQGQYEQGINAGVQSILQAIQGEYLPLQTEQQQGKSSTFDQVIPFVMFGAVGSQMLLGQLLGFRRKKRDLQSRFIAAGGTGVITGLVGGLLLSSLQLGLIAGVGAALLSLIFFSDKGGRGGGYHTGGRTGGGSFGGGFGGGGGSFGGGGASGGW